MVSIELFTNRFNVHWRYIHNRLQSPLQPDKLYYLEFMHYVGWAGYQIKKYQVFFSHDWYSEPYPEGQLFIELEPHFETAQDEWAPFDEWTIRSGCFSVDEPFQYMMFGNFNGANTDTFTYRLDALQAYIQFDNFALYEVEELKHDDIVVCPSEAYILPYYRLSGMVYVLADDTLGNELPLLSPGEYFVDQYLEGCGLIHTFKVEVRPCEAPCRNIPSDRKICAFEPFMFSDEYDYLYNSEPIYSGDFFPSGIHHIAVSDSICGVFSTMTLDVSACEDCIELSWKDTTICIGDEFLLPQYPEIEDLRFIVGGNIISGRSVNMQQSGSFEMVLTSKLCSLSLPVNLYIDDCQACPIYLPTAFSPNRDGINDVFKVYTECSWIEAELKVFDRWGSLLFTGSAEQGWNGSFRGQQLDEGVYLYQLIGKMRDGLVEKEIIKAGEIYLLR